MRFVKWILIPVVILAAIGFGVYQFGVDYAIDKVSEEMENSGKMEEVKAMVKNDPELEAFIKEVENSPEIQQYLEGSTTDLTESENNETPAAKAEPLPFDTKEEAMKVVVDRVGMTKLTGMAKDVQDGTLSKQEAIDTLSTEFTEEEMTALKVIAYKELYSK
ncbi:hypothetical protein [Niallia endozanthoxylica]|uniref:Phenylalanyl-tRNA synthetase subunit beta n=1 Tax=Niallia endozanthoxylica TaxID=2036016 RepID=A0A5J5GVN3_9BACI|nr:hypothetical protein [Niallia endozanthoxylica]KAA9012225.1 hypothetical protein F4V44_25935 [Niallia endozanthoxylica]